MLVVGAERETRKIQIPFLYAVQQFGCVARRAALADVYVHAARVARVHRLFRRALVIVVHACRRIGGKHGFRHTGSVSVYRPALEERDLVRHFGLAFRRVPETHHLPQAHHHGTADKLFHVRGKELARAVGVERGCRHSRRQTYEYVGRRLSALLHKLPQSGRSGDVDHFVGICDDRRGAERQYRLSERLRQYHAGLYVNVRVYESGGDDQPGTIDAFRAVRGNTAPYRRNEPVGDQHVRPLHFARFSVRDKAAFQDILHFSSAAENGSDATPNPPIRNFIVQKATVKCRFRHFRFSSMSASRYFSTSLSSSTAGLSSSHSSRLTSAPA